MPLCDVSISVICKDVHGLRCLSPQKAEFHFYKQMISLVIVTKTTDIYEDDWISCSNVSCCNAAHRVTSTWFPAYVNDMAWKYCINNSRFLLYLVARNDTFSLIRDLEMYLVSKSPVPSLRNCVHIQLIWNGTSFEGNVMPNELHLCYHNKEMLLNNNLASHKDDIKCITTMFTENEFVFHQNSLQKPTKTA